MDLKEKARKLPEIPGVYVMRDSYGNIIYVGKAKSLKNRVSQYFQSSNRHAPKIIRMIENIKTFDYIPADTELEALLLECRMIKDLKPMYNSQMKNDLGYVYVRLASENEFPTFEIVREKTAGEICFGPYTSEKSVERALEALQDNFRLRSCKSFTARKSGCLRQQLGLCMAPCTEKIDIKEYTEQAEGALGFLEGRKLELLTLLQNKMEAAAEALDFARAAKYRDDIRALKRMTNRQKAVGFTQQNRNIAAVERLDASTAKLFIMQGSHIVYKARLELNSIDKGGLQRHIAGSILACLRELGRKSSTLDKQEVDQAHIVFSYLKNKKECSYMLIPKSWLKGNNISKLEQSTGKLIDKIYI